MTTKQTAPIQLEMKEFYTRHEIYAFLSTIFKEDWGISFCEVGNNYGCSISSKGNERMGIGSTMDLAYMEALTLWGIPVIHLGKSLDTSKALPTGKVKVEVLKPETSVPPKVEPKKPSVWNDKRTEKMLEIKSKLRLSDNDQFSIHIETWSKGSAHSILDLNEGNADSFIDYMFKKYINRINTSGLDNPGSGGANTDEEAF